MHISPSKRLPSLLTLHLILSNVAMADSGDSSMTQKLFQVDSQTLANGLHIIRHHRDDSDTFSAQVVVELGLSDFDCKNKQVPHLLEHMLFEGTERFDSKTLRQRVLDHGGKSQAFTVDEYTHFTVHVHSDYPQIAFENLYSMITESRFSKVSFEKSKQIIHTEQGTSSGAVNPLWSSAGILTDQAKAQLFSGTQRYCSQLSNPDPINYKTMMNYFRSHYVASNMTLILIGHFNDQEVNHLIEQTFAKLPESPKPAATKLAQTNPRYGPIRAKRPMLNPQADLLLYVPAVGKRHPDYPAFEIIAEYFSEQLFYEVRGEKALGYTPRARIDANGELGVLEASTGTSDALLKKAETAFLEMYNQLRTQGISNHNIERIKRKLILRFESKQRDHNHLAQLYRHHREAIKTTGDMPNLVQSLEQVQPDHIASLLAQFPSQPLVATLVRPPISRAIVYIILISIVFTGLAWPLLRWIRKSSG